MTSIVFHYISLAFLTIGVLQCLAIFLPYYKARKLYGRIPYSLLRQMISYASKSPSAHFIWQMKLLIIFWVGYESLHFAQKLSEPPRLLLAGIGLMISSRVILFILPPSVLFLSSSSEFGAKQFAELSKQLWPFRTVALLRPMQNWPHAEYQSWFSRGCLRTSNNYEWRTIVFHLMDIVPMIVISEEDNTAGVQEEWNRIRAKHYEDRTIQINKTVSNASIQRILNQLQRTHDQAIRLARQTEYTEMLFWVPPALRYSRSLNDIVVRSRHIGHYLFERYLRRCKGITSSDKLEGLLEDIPSLVTPEEELSFLSSGRAYDEIEILLKSALEDVGRNKGQNSDYNMVNCFNNLGKIARQLHRWDDAINFLNQAIQFSVRIPEDTWEVATSHYLLGEVYTLLFRKTKNPDQKQLAINAFRKSIQLDKSAGRKTSDTENLLSSIERSTSQYIQSTVLTTSPMRTALPEPKPWHAPGASKLISLATALLSLIVLYFLANKLLSLPNGWYTRAVWPLVPWWKKLFANVIIFGGSLFSLFLSIVALNMPPRSKQP